MKPDFRPYAIALATLALIMTAQALTTYANRNGCWAGLFYTGQLTPVPAELKASTCLDASPSGYDGQYYRFLAHDPFLVRHADEYMDGALVRCRRILLPLAAYVLGLGQAAAIDWAYILLLDGAMAVAAGLLALIAVEAGLSPLFGFTVLLMPSAVVSIDRMTLDGALVTFMLALIVAWRRGWGPGAVWSLLAGACLLRETALLIVAAWVLHELWARRWRRAAVYLSSALPLVAWELFIRARFTTQTQAIGERSIPVWLVPRWKFGLLEQALHPPAYEHLPAAWVPLVQGADALGLFAFLGLVILAAVWIRKAENTPLHWATGLHVLFAFGLTSPEFWLTPFGYGRPFAPLFALLMTGAGGPLTRRRCLAVSGLLLVIFLRMAGVDLARQAVGVLRWAHLA